MARHGVAHHAIPLHRQVEKMAARHDIDGIGNACAFLNRNWTARHDFRGSKPAKIMPRACSFQKIDLADEADDMPIHVDNRYSRRMVLAEVHGDRRGILVESKL